MSLMQVTDNNELLRNSEAKTYPELVALGFWLRKSNLKKMQNLSPIGVIKPLGWVVHFTPSNVDTMFIYSWICSLLDLPRFHGWVPQRAVGPQIAEVPIL